MKPRFLFLIILLASMAQPAIAQQANAPLAKDQILDLVQTGMDNDALAKKIAQRGIDFEPSDDDLGFRCAAQELIP